MARLGDHSSEAPQSEQDRACIQRTGSRRDWHLRASSSAAAAAAATLLVPEAAAAAAAAVAAAGMAPGVEASRVGTAPPARHDGRQIRLWPGIKQ